MKYLAIGIALLFLGCVMATENIEPLTPPPPYELHIKVLDAEDRDIDVSECPDEYPDVSRSMTIKNPEGELGHLTFVLGDTAHFKLFSHISSSDSTHLWQDVTILKHMGITDLHVYINSGGGSAYDGLALADTLSYARRSGMAVTTYAVGLVASAAVPVFASGGHRVAMESAQFMVHKSKIGKYLAYESEDELQIQRVMLQGLRERYIKILVDNSNLSKDEWEDKIECTTYFSAKDAEAWGLVQEIK